MLQAVRGVPAGGRVHVHVVVVVDVDHGTTVSVDTAVLGNLWCRRSTDHLGHDDAGQSPVEGSRAVLGEECALGLHVTSDRHILAAITIPVTLAPGPRVGGADVHSGFRRSVDDLRLHQCVRAGGGRGGEGQGNGASNECHCQGKEAISHFSLISL